MDEFFYDNINCQIVICIFGIELLLIRFLEILLYYSWYWGFIN